MCTSPGKNGSPKIIFKFFLLKYGKGGLQRFNPNLVCLHKYHIIYIHNKQTISIAKYSVV